MKINVTTKPSSRKGPLIEIQPDGSFLAYIREIPAENQANEALIKLIANHFQASKTKVRITRGHKSRHKIIEIER